MSKTSHLSPQYLFFFLLIWKNFSYSCLGHGSWCHFCVQMQKFILKGRRLGQGMFSCTKVLLGTFPQLGEDSIPCCSQFGGTLWLTGLDVLQPWLHWFSWHFKSARALRLQHSRTTPRQWIRQTQGWQETLGQDAFKLFLDYFRNDLPGWLSTHWIDVVKWYFFPGLSHTCFKHLMYSTSNKHLNINKNTKVHISWLARNN